MALDLNLNAIRHLADGPLTQAYLVSAAEQLRSVALVFEATVSRNLANRFDSITKAARFAVGWCCRRAFFLEVFGGVLIAEIKHSAHATACHVIFLRKSDNGHILEDDGTS